MSLESDMLFTHADSCLESNFGNLPEFDDFPKDMFLCNVTEAIANQSLLEELDCQDGMKPLFNSEVNDAFGVSLSGADGGIIDSSSTSPLTMLLTEELAEQLELIASQLLKMETSPCSHDQQAHGMGPTSGLASLSLDDFDLAQLHSNNALSTHSSPAPHHEAAGCLSQPSRTKSAPLLGLLSPPMKKGFVKRETRSLSSIDPTFLQIGSPVSSPSPKATFSTSEDVSLFGMLYRDDDGLSIHGGVKEPLSQPVQSMGVVTESFYPAENASPSPRVDIFASFRDASVGAPHIIQEQASHNPSLQRSQSSHTLGQLWLPTCLGSENNEFNTPPVCEQEMVLASATNASQFTPYEVSITRGMMGRSSVTPIRRVSSAGDLQAFNGVQNAYGGSSENTLREESSQVKIGHYTTEERKMKLHRYRQKRTERNFNKKIKYACRKTLADSRPRVRGRFARSDEMGDMAMKGGHLPLIDEYEELTSYRPRVIPEVAYSVHKDSCIMSNNGIPRFWSAVGMKVAM